eukprot:jgi/Ulvmu1/2132/UM128_0002.1
MPFSSATASGAWTTSGPAQTLRPSTICCASAPAPESAPSPSAYPGRAGLWRRAPATSGPSRPTQTSPTAAATTATSGRHRRNWLSLAVPGDLHASAAWCRPPLAAGTSPTPTPDQIVAAANPPKLVPTTFDTEQLCADTAALHLRSAPPPPPPPETGLDSVRLPASVTDRARRDGSPGDSPLYGICPSSIFSPDYAALCEQFPLAIDFDSQGPNSDTTQGHGSAPLVATMAGDIPCGRPSIPGACTGSEILPPSPHLDAPYATASADSAPAAASPASSGDLASDTHRAFKDRTLTSS